MTRTQVIEPDLATPRDAREDEDWFQRLPADVQERMRREWARRWLRDAAIPLRRRQRQRRMMREVALLFAPMLLFVNAFVLTSLSQTMGLIACAAIGGAGIGGVLATSPAAGRFTSAALGAVTFVLVELTTVEIAATPLDLVTFFCGLWLAATVLGIYGLRVESRGLPGSGEE